MAAHFPVTHSFTHYKCLLGQNLSFLISKVLQHLVQKHLLKNGEILNYRILEGFSTDKGIACDSWERRKTRPKRKQNDEIMQQQDERKTVKI